VDVLKSISVSGPQGVVRMDATTHHARVNTYLSRCQANGEFSIVDTFGDIDPILPERYNHQRISHQATLEADIRLQARMLEQMSEAVFLVDANDQTVVYANAGADRMCGFNKGEQIGQHLSRLIASPLSQEDTQETAASIVRLLEQKGAWLGETCIVRKDGTIVWCSVSVSTFTHPIFGEVWLWVACDIGARKRAEDALKQLNQELEQRVEQRTAELKAAKNDAEHANAAKSQFLSRMSHEFRTPMNAILGFGQLLESDPEQPLSVTQVDFVREIMDAGNHLLKLINEVLNLSRIESGQREIKLEGIPIAPLIEACAAQIEPIASKRGIKVATNINARLVVLANSAHLKDVLLNFLGNAVKYNRENGEIQVSCAPADGNRLRISVRDTGRGIATEALPRLFKAFERVESAYDGIDGLGIGLALSKKLVDAMHGQIGATSTLNGGSTFWIELPEAINKFAVTPPRTPVENARWKILYIEDNASNLRLVQKIVSMRDNLEMIGTETAELGLEIAQNQHPALILIDINLPGMNGFEAARLLRENPITRTIPLIAITANAMPRDVERGKAAGFDDYLVKPLDISLFLKTLDRCLAARTKKLV